MDLLWQRVRAQPAAPLAWLELLKGYRTLELDWQANYVARQARRLNADSIALNKALEYGDARQLQGDDGVLGRSAVVDAARRILLLEAQVRAHPGDWLSWLYLARLLEMSPQESADLSASKALTSAQALEPLVGESLHMLGVWRLNADEPAAAVQAFSGLLSITPLRHGSMLYLGEALLRIDNLPAAEKAFARASLSSNPDFLLLLAQKVYAHNYWREAQQVLRKALDLYPSRADLWLALAHMQSEVYDLEDCRQSVARILALEPQNAQAKLLQAGLQGRMGDARAHLSLLQAAHLKAGDPMARTASGIAMTALYNDQLSAQEVMALHREVCAPIESGVAAHTTFSNERSSQRRLRIGFVTGDLHRQHPVNIFMLPVLKRLDHKRFEVCVYHTGTMHDGYTRQAKQAADRWLEAAKLDDTALQRAIVSDEVDVLVDLAGHTSSHRLGVFAMRAAPVQATFLGYPHSTGLSRINWLIGDATVSPKEHAHLFSEGIAQLPGSVFCWSNDEIYPLPQPRAPDAPLVLGSFNNAMKLCPQTIALWANVLKALPDALLLLKAPSLRDSAVQARFTTLFSDQGIDAERLMFRGPTGLADMMQEYGDIDIALDPTPYNGGTTTLQALWMGVPVVTLLGGNFVSRMGASFMRTLGRPEWVAQTESAYVDAVVKLAGDLPALRASRSALRERMATSALCDIQTYVRHFENLLVRMWDDELKGKTSGKLLLNNAA